jgi:hypothetical protein
MSKSNLKHELPERGHGMELLLACIERPIYAVALNVAAVAVVNVYFNYGVFGQIFLFVLLPITFLAVFLLCMVIGSHLDNKHISPEDWSAYLEDKSGVLAPYRGRKIPIQTVQELYINGKIDLKKGHDLIDVLKRRNSLFNFSITLDHARFFIDTLVKDALSHS